MNSANQDIEAACRRLQSRLRLSPGWSVGDEMARYILGRIGNATQGATAIGQPFRIFASDARTGRPLHDNFDPAWLSEAQLPLF